MTEFTAVGYEWRAIPGADNASVELEVIGEIEGLFVWAAVQPAAVDRPGSAKVFRRSMPPQISVGAGKLWVKASGDRNCYIDYDILAGGAGGVDITARDLAQAVTGEPGEAVPTGETRSIIGRDWYNPTAAAVTIPGTPTVANLAALGLIEDVPNASSELYDTVQTAADVTHTALARGVQILTATGAKIARLPTGIAVPQERRFLRVGPNPVDIFIGTGTTEKIYTRNLTTGALETAADGGVRLNFDESWVLLKKTGPASWEVYEHSHSGAGSGSSAALPAPLAAASSYATATAPPATPAEGTAVAVVAVATGVFAGQEGKIATFTGGAWTFAAPADGTSAVIGGVPSRYSAAIGIWVPDPVVNTVTPAGGTIASLTAAEQALVGPDTRVMLANGSEAKWNGTAPKTDPANYTTTPTVIDGGTA